MSVLKFCQRAKDLLASNQLPSTLRIKFARTGQNSDGTQACIDPVFNRVAPDHRLVAIRDYDSLLGISSRIVHPVSEQEDTFSSNIHMKYLFTTAK